MKNFLFLLILYMSMPILSFGQEPIPEAEQETPVQPIKFVIGLEGGYGVHQTKGPGITSVGLTLDVPVKRFSFGTGISYKSMGTSKYMAYTGYSYTKKEDENLITYNEFDRHEVELEYISIPLRVQVRLPCNCVYVQGGVEIDFLKKDTDKITETVQYTIEKEPYLEENIVKDINYSFVVGLGFKLHESRRLRILMRPEYEFMLNPIKKKSSYHEASVLNRLKFNLGIQYGI